MHDTNAINFAVEATVLGTSFEGVKSRCHSGTVLATIESGLTSAATCLENKSCKIKRCTAVNFAKQVSGFSLRNCDPFMRKRFSQINWLLAWGTISGVSALPPSIS